MKVLESFNILLIGSDCMQDKLPKIFANKVGNLQNNRKYYYSERDKDININQNSSSKDKEVINKYNLNDIVRSSDINKKIIDLFKSPTNVYKVKANIKMNGKTVTKSLIGRTNSTLITLDDEIINIADIEDISISN